MSGGSIDVRRHGVVALTALLGFCALSLATEVLLAGVEPKVFVPEPGFRKLFDGRTLAGWEGRPGFWVEEMKPSEISLMPAGLLKSLTEAEIQDLVAFLLARENSKDKPPRL
jgi:hypothetical protein